MCIAIYSVNSFFYFIWLDLLGTCMFSTILEPTSIIRRVSLTRMWRSLKDEKCTKLAHTINDVAHQKNVLLEGSTYQQP